MEREPGITIYSQLLQLTSEGTVKITSADPQAELATTPNWLSTEADCEAVVAIVKTMRRFTQQPALAPNVGTELFPGADYRSDAQILDIFRRASLCGTHAVATCRMGRDADSVVDERLRVRGTTGLRVADCSVMPGLVSGITNGPAMALGWLAGGRAGRGGAGGGFDVAGQLGAGALTWRARSVVNDRRRSRHRLPPLCGAHG